MSEKVFSERLAVSSQPPKARDGMLVADLVLELTDLGVAEIEPGVSRAVARAVFVFDPPEAGAPQVRSRPFRFVAPLGGIEADELAWYIERYPKWPLGEVVTNRARTVEQNLEVWGRKLFDAALGEKQEGRNAYDAWRNAPAGTERCFSVLVDDNMLAEATDDQKQQARGAATSLLALPWELIHDGSGFLFVGGRGARVRRRLPNQLQKDQVQTSSPLRILLVSPRPEEDGVPYIDHRVSARPLVEALAPLGELAELCILNPPTYAALSAELDRAEKDGKPYHVVHFDGHGVFDRSRRDGPGGRQGLGALVFEHPDDLGKLFRRRHETVDCEKLATLIKDRRVPLFFLEACQSAHAETDPTSSVAGTLLQGGAASVAAMSHTVLVETARRFVGPFYQALLQGERVGQAMLAGQKVLHDDANRGRGFGGELRLQDWFVPVLFQEETDPQLVRQVPAQRVREEIEQTAQARPRCRARAASAPLRGPEPGAAGRRAAAAEHGPGGPASLRRDPGRGGRGQDRAGLRARPLAGRQPAVPEGRVREPGAHHRGPRLALGARQAARARLRRPGEGGRQAGMAARRAGTAGPADAAGDRQRRVRAAALRLGGRVRRGRTRGVRPGSPGRDPGAVPQAGGDGRAHGWSSPRGRPCPRPSTTAGRALDVGRLSPSEALELVGNVLGEGGRIPGTRTDLESREKVEELVAVLGGHARSLVLIARELRGGQPLGETTEGVRRIMARLEQQHPGEREQSLFASVELSLRKLPPDLRAKLPPLGVFHGGGQWLVDRTGPGARLREGRARSPGPGAHRRRPGRIAGVRLPPARPGAGAVPAPRAGRRGASGCRGPLGGGDRSAHVVSLSETAF